MSDLGLADHTVSQGRALVRAIEGLGTIERLDAEIDTLVYELCGLTEEEIAVAERLSKETASRPWAPSESTSIF